MEPKYLLDLAFDAQAINGTTTSATSKQVEIYGYTRIWAHCNLSNSSSLDVALQLQVSNDPISKSEAESDWVNEGSARDISSSSDNVMHKYDSIGASKIRWSVSRDGGAGNVSVRAVLKEQ